MAAAMTAAAAATPDEPAGAPMAASAASIVPRVPRIIGGLRWPMWPMRKPRPSWWPEADPEREAGLVGADRPQAVGVDRRRRGSS